MPPGGRVWVLEVVNRSARPATLVVAADDRVIGETVGTATPSVVPPGATVRVAFGVPPGRGWAIFVNAGPERGALPPARRPAAGGRHRDRLGWESRAGSTASDARSEPTDPVLTERLVLTPVGPDDIDDLVLLYGDPLVAYWTGPWTRETTAAWAADMAARWTGDGVGKWMARDRADGSLVGRGGFTRFDLGGESVLELGWAVRDARTGQGYATELGWAALAWAAAHLPDLPIVAFTEVHNRASRAVMERLGMHDAGIIRRRGLIEGRTGVQPDAPFALYRR